MPKLKFTGNWNSFWMKEYSIPKGKGFVLLQMKESYIDKVSPAFKKLNDLQVKALAEMQGPGEDYLKDLDFTMEFHYRKRTLDQNALMWSLYEIEANEQNGGMSGHKDQMVTMEELYLADLNEHGEIEYVKTTRKNLPAYTAEYSHMVDITYMENAYSLEEIKKIEIADEDIIEIKAIRSTSKFNTLQMGIWIDRIFNRLAYAGVSMEHTSEIADYWLKFKEDLNNNKVVLHDTLMSKDEYRQLNPSCEACGNYIVDSGHLAHIKAVGMGNDRTEELPRNYTSNWLHLCVKCHIGEQHNDGWTEFLEKHSHLSHKVNTALKREYEPLETEIVKPNEELIKDAITAYNAGEIDKHEACQLIDELGGDGTIIDKKWIGIY